MCSYFYQNWLAFMNLHKPPFSEHNVIHFINNRAPQDAQNNAFCKVSCHCRFSYFTDYFKRLCVLFDLIKTY